MVIKKKEIRNNNKKSSGSRKKLSEKAKLKQKLVNVGEGRVFAKFSFNNTIMSITKTNGSVLEQVSGGYLGFKNTKKSTPFVAQKCVESVIKNISERYNMRQVELWVSGVGAGREVVMKRMLGDSSFSVTALVDKTPVAYGGCRPRKRPRK